MASNDNGSDLGIEASLFKTADKLRGVADFNLAFTRARSMSDMLVAYYHAYRMAEFIATTHGPGPMKRMLVLWGKKRSTARVFEGALGVRDLAAFNTDRTEELAALKAAAKAAGTGS